MVGTSIKTYAIIDNRWTAYSQAEKGDFKWSVGIFKENIKSKTSVSIIIKFISLTRRMHQRDREAMLCFSLVGP